MMGTREGAIRGGPSEGRTTLFHKVCVDCGKTFTPNKDEDAQPKDDVPEGFFMCKKHRDELCNDCFYADVAEDTQLRAFNRSLHRALKSRLGNLYGYGEVSSSERDDETPQSSESSPSSLKRCAHCGKAGDLGRCAKCKGTYYCCRSPQAADYAKHKATCQAPNADAIVQPSKVCAYCGMKPEKLSRCARCQCTWYCSVEHQKAHYPEHKRECRNSSSTVPIDQFPFCEVFGSRPGESEDKMSEESRVILWKSLP